MITRRTFATTVLAAGLGVHTTTRAADATSDELAVFSFNLRYASPNPPNSWPERRPVMKALFERSSPDLVGTQEGVYHQLRDLAADLPAWDWIGTGRDGGSRGEFMAVFFKRDRLEPLEFDHFWLSDTPNVIGSTTWGNTNRRMVTWVRFKDRRTGREFHFWNSHFDHANQTAREKSAELVRKRIAQVDASKPLIFAADFNAVATDNRVYDLLVKEGGLTDSWFAAAERRNAEYDSFNDFRPPLKNGHRIDWILFRGAIDVRATEIITYSQNGQFPSDHFPLAAWLRLR